MGRHGIDLGWPSVSREPSRIEIEEEQRGGLALHGKDQEDREVTTSVGEASVIGPALLSLVRERRSPALLDRERPVPSEAVWAALECAVRAPNHHATHPWRFAVVEGEARERIGQVYAQEQLTLGSIPAARLALEAAKMTRAPVVVVAHFLPAADETVRFEDTLAVGAAIENLILALDAVGLSVLWRTGRMASSPALRDALGIDREARIAGILYIGYRRADVPLPPRKEIAAADVTQRV